MVGGPVGLTGVVAGFLGTKTHAQIVRGEVRGPEGLTWRLTKGVTSLWAGCCTDA
jgi:hypothetical protein